MLKYFITQKDFFKKIKKQEYVLFENNMCGLVNIFLILKNLSTEKFSLNEKDILVKALELNAYNENIGWKYNKLIELFKYFSKKLEINYKKISTYNTRFFHNLRLKFIFKNFSKTLFIASVKFDENHLIIISKVENGIVYYSSVGTKNKVGQKDAKILLNDFFNIYNKRGILLKY